MTQRTNYCKCKALILVKIKTTFKTKLLRNKGITMHESENGAVTHESLPLLFCFNLTATRIFI